MITSKPFLIGLAVGLALPIAYHMFVKPIPRGKSGG